MYNSVIKPFFDLVCATLLLLLSLPIIFIPVVLLAIANNGQIFFVQPRPGYKSKIFNVLKFKTMNDKKDLHGNLLPDKDRLTPIGKFIRTTSIDEIPQLINVIKGDMSLVGPRPLLVEYLSLYNQVQKRRHDVKPGITGWAQVNGRNAISWQKKFEYDVWYVEKQNFLLDIKIVFLTILKVFKAEGISSTTTVTMEKFTGNE